MCFVKEELAYLQSNQIINENSLRHGLKLVVFQVPIQKPHHLLEIYKYICNIYVKYINNICVLSC